MYNLRKILRIVYIQLLIIPIFIGVIAGQALSQTNEQKVIRVGTELDFPPYAFLNKDGEPVGFSIDLIRAVTESMGISITFTAESWDSVWNGLVSGNLDALPIVAKSPERHLLVKFSLPHTETFDAFFVRKGDSSIKNISAAESKQIVVMRSDAAHHELLVRKLDKNLHLVDTIPDGLKLIASGKYDTFLCSKLIGTLLLKKTGIEGLSAGPAIPNYKRVFSFAVKKGDEELLEKLNQGLLIVKTNGEYERIYNKWLTVVGPWHKIKKIFLPAILIMAAIVLIAGIWVASLQRIVKKRNNEISKRIQIEKELRESEERFRILFDNAPLPYQSLDENGNFIEVNLRWLNLLGYSREEVVGKSFADFLHPDWIDHFKENFPKFKSIGEILGVEFELRKKDGSYIWTSFDGKIRHDDEGAFIQTHCVFNDITEKRRLEKKIKEQEEALRQAQKLESIGNLAGGIAHDFNNILSSVIGFTELALDDAMKGSSQEDNLQEVYMASKRAKDLVTQILAFARQTNEEIRPVQISKIIHESLKFLRSSIPTTIEIEKELNSESLTLGNETLIEQAIINLATNAMHAMEENGGLLTIRLSDVYMDEPTAKKQHLIKSGNYIQIAISDTGVGIPSDAVGSIFEPYFTTKEVGKGTGMGLAIVHGTVKKYGGTIMVDSRPGHGTTFTILLPATKMHEKANPYQPSDLPRGTERIIFVDDELPITKMAKQLLEKLGYAVTTRSSSAEALELFQINPNDFDLVVTDMTMPNLTGDKLAVELMKIRPDIPIVLCTGYSKTISDETASEIGIKAFAYKPVVKAELAKTVRKVLDEAKDTGQG